MVRHFAESWIRCVSVCVCMCVSVCVYDVIQRLGPGCLSGQTGGCCGPWENSSWEQVNMSQRSVPVVRAFSHTCPIFPSNSCQNTVGQKLIFKEFTHSDSKGEKHQTSAQRHSV